MGLISNGTTLLDAGALDSGIATGAMTLIKTLTASSSATLSFVHGASSVVFDGTYKEYQFHFVNMHPASNDVNFQFNVSIDGGSNYNVAKTTTRFTVLHSEDDSSHAALAYEANRDLAQGTGDKIIMNGVGNVADESCSGLLHLYEPASTTFVKNFEVRGIQNRSDNTSEDAFGAGYINTTSAVNAIIFKFGSGNIDTGTIKMYGIK